MRNSIEHKRQQSEGEAHTSDHIRPCSVARDSRYDWAPGERALTYIVTGPARQAHALPILRPPHQHLCRYALVTLFSATSKVADLYQATLYMMTRMVFGKKTWY